MRLLEIVHTGKDELGNDGHNAVIELDDGSLVYIPDIRGGVEFVNNPSEKDIISIWVCDGCNVVMPPIPGNVFCYGCGEKMKMAKYGRIT